MIRSREPAIRCNLFSLRFEFASTAFQRIQKKDLHCYQG